MEFKKYPKIERFTNYTQGTFYIFPKLDGANASIWYDGKIRFGSRNNERTNSGFRGMDKWIEDNNKQLMNFFFEHTHLRLYGEWLVKHICQHADSAWNKFYVFDVYNDKDESWLSIEEYQPLLEQAGIEMVPKIRVIENPDVSVINEIANNNFYLMAPDAGLAEGVVLKDYAGGQIFKYKIEKQKHNKPDTIQENVYEKMASKLPYSTIEQEHSKMVLEREWKNKMIPEFMERVWKAYISEEFYRVIKKMKLKIVVITALKKEVDNLTRSYLRDKNLIGD